MVEKRLGVELDGPRATVVEVTGHAAVSAQTYIGATPADALAKALEGVKPGKKAPKIRVALVSSSSAVRKIDLTQSTLSDRRAFEAAIAAAIPNVHEGSALAALVLNPQALVGDALSSGLAAVAPSEPVDGAYRAISRFIDAEIVAPAFTLVGFDGLHLALRYTNAELTLVENGAPVLHRQLPGGGLSSLAETLGEGVLGVERLEAAINHQGNLDMIAEDAIRTYLRRLVAEVSKTRSHWLRTGEEVPENIHIFGAGARMREIHEFLEDEELTAVVDEDMVRLMAYIPVGARESAVGAFLAGASYGVGAPFSVYPSPVVREKLLAARQRRKVTNRVLIGLAALTIPLAAYFGPVGAGAYAINQAEGNKADAQANFDTVVKANQELARVQSIEDQYALLASADPRWSDLILGSFSTAADNQVTIDTISSELVDSEIVVTVTAHAPDPAATYRPLTAWLSALEDPNGPVAATSIYTSGFSFSDLTQESSFQVRYTVDPSTLLEERSLDGAQR